MCGLLTYGTQSTCVDEGLDGICETHCLADRLCCVRLELRPGRIPHLEKADLHTELCEKLEPVTDLMGCQLVLFNHTAWV